MDWRIKASIQKILSVSRLGDKVNHSLITFNKRYHENVVIYQFHETLRKFKHAKLNMSHKLVALELGTGYSLISAVTLALLGFQKIITVDITCDISFDTFKKQIAYFNDKQITETSKHSKFSRSELYKKINLINRVPSLKELFELLNIIYIAPYNFEDIEKNSPHFDYITSQVVLEHVPPSILDKFFKKTKQWLSLDGYSVHTINFIDHFANPGLFRDKSISEFNFLQYSNRYWKFWTGNSLAYTNRLSYLFYLQLCKKYNLELVEFIGENYRESVKLNPSLIHEDVIKKYDKPPNRDKLTEFQRGTLIIKA